MLVDSNVRALEASSHATGTKSSLSDFPHPVHNSVKDEIVRWSTKAQAASEHGQGQQNIQHIWRDLLDDIVSELIQKQRRRISTKVLGNESDFIGTRNAFDNLLGGPSAVLVNTDHAKMRADPFQHGNTRNSRTFFEEFLNNLQSSKQIRTVQKRR